MSRAVGLEEGAAMSEVPEAPRHVGASASSGLATVLNVIISPKEAFASIRIAPTWGWAFVIAEILVLIGSIMILPAVQHAFDIGWAERVGMSPQLSQMSAAEQARAQSFARAFVNITPVFALLTIPISMLIQTIIMLIFNALGKGTGTFQTMWASVANISVVGAGLGSIVLGIIVVAHGAQNIDSPNSIQSLMPSLALLVPGAPLKIASRTLSNKSVYSLDDRARYYCDGRDRIRSETSRVADRTGHPFITYRVRRSVCPITVPHMARIALVLRVLRYAARRGMGWADDPANRGSAGPCARQHGATKTRGLYASAKCAR